MTKPDDGNCPYKTLQAPAYWRRSVAAPKYQDVDPVVAPRFTFDAKTKVATAGSCFAQHIARYLQSSGGNYFVAEPGHPVLPAAIRQEYGYGLFSARYGNVYTTRQLLQLFDRAYGDFVPAEHPWGTADALIDPFRPTVQPGGFPTRDEFDSDRIEHFSSVRRMFEELDVFVFTLGLTEGWASKADGAVFPVCPGCGAGGVFDPQKYVFVNERVSEVQSELAQFIERLRRVNSRARILLTVSPVPLVATYSGKHVLTATTYSKSVLRAAVGEIVEQFDHVDYFPSYEIITGHYNRGRYYAEDLRSIEEAGVSHVMGLLFKHYFTMKVSAPASATPTSLPPQPEAAEETRAPTRSQLLAKLVCDEELLER